MRRHRHTGRDPAPTELAEAKRIASLTPECSIRIPPSSPPIRLAHINSYGALLDY